MSANSCQEVLNAILIIVEKTRRKVRPIARKRRNFIYLLLAILFGIITSYIFVTFSPEYLIPVSNFGVPVLPIFLASLTIFIFSAVTFIFIQRIQGALISLLTFSYLIVRLLGLTHWIFVLLFIALFITIELFVVKKK